MRRPFLHVFLLLALAAVPGPGTSFAQDFDHDLWVTNGSVLTTARWGDLLYLGGNFTIVGPATGGAVPVDGAGDPVSGFPDVAGFVYAVAPDGSGGWYLGGDFATVGGIARSNLAHVTAAHQVSSWDPSISSTVYALAVDGTNVIVGGQFSTVGVTPRSNLAAVDRTTGLATAWDPSPDATVRRLEVNGSSVFVAGDFINIGGQARNYIAQVDLTSGLSTAWNANANGPIYGLDVSGPTVYVGGSFNNIGGQPRTRLAALDAVTGTDTGWNPGADGEVDVVRVAGSSIYVGGYFFNAGGQPRLRIAEIDAGTGLATSWNPSADNTVFDILVGAPEIYVAGTFTNIGGQTRPNLAALSPVTGAATSWDPQPNGTVVALAQDVADILVAGAISSVGGETRRAVAAIDLTTGQLTPWNPSVPSGYVKALAVSADGTTVYAGGSYTAIGGQARSNLAALSAVTGLATGWNPAPTGLVLALEVVGNTVYAGGGFASIGGQPRSNLAAVSAVTGLATTWNPGAGSGVEDILVVGDTVYVAGSFTTAGGQPRSRLAAIDRTTGLATAFDPDVGGSFPSVYSVARDGATLYLGGFFTTVGGQPRSGLAAVHATSGAVTPWDPGPDNLVRAVVVQGATVYAGGDFDLVGGVPHAKVVALDIATGLVRDWDPQLDTRVWTLAPEAPTTIFAGGEFEALGGTSHSGLARIQSAPALTAVTPDHAGNAGPVTLSLAGSGLPDGATLDLFRDGFPDIPGGPAVVRADGLGIAAIFDLNGTALGNWHIRVTTPDSQVAALFNGLTVEDPAPHQLRVDIVAPPLIRPNRRRPFDVVVQNLGNGDVTAVPLWFSGIPPDATIEHDFTIGAPPNESDEPDWSLAPTSRSIGDSQYLAMVIPRLPPGTRTFRFYLTVPNSVTSFDLEAALTAPWDDGTPLKTCLAAQGLTTDPACMGASLSYLDAWMALAAESDVVNGIGAWAKVAWTCEGTGSLGASIGAAQDVLDLMRDAVTGGDPPAGCGSALDTHWHQRVTVGVVSSVDPNIKLGTPGYGPDHRVGVTQTLPYTIQFENLDTATAPAQEVIVFDALDMDAIDVASVSLSAITFSGHTLVPPPGVRNFSATVDLRPGTPLLVRVNVNLDVPTGILAWTYTSLDPATGLPPDEPTVGFLPPNVTPPEGEGSVQFTALPNPALAGGAEIGNLATISFDGVPIETASWVNTMDKAAPDSEVLPLAATQDSASFTVHWALNGSPDDLRDFSVYVSEDGAAFRPWRLHTLATADTFAAHGGRAYAFYSLARDSSGNLEPVPLSADAETFTTVAVGGPASPAFALEGAIPNPSVGRGVVWLSLPARGPAVLEVTDVAGRRLLRRDVGALGPGRHAVDVRDAMTRPGLYFLTLTRGGDVRRTRMVVLR